MKKSERQVRAYLSRLDAGLVTVDPELSEIADLRRRLSQAVQAPPMAARIRAEERMLTALADRAAAARQPKGSPFFDALPKAVIAGVSLFVLSGLGITASAAVGGPSTPAEVFAAVGIGMPAEFRLDFGPFHDTTKDFESSPEPVIVETVAPAAVIPVPAAPVNAAPLPRSSNAGEQSSVAVAPPAASDAPAEQDSGSAAVPTQPSASDPAPAPEPAPAPAPAPDDGKEPPGQSKDNGNGLGASHR